MSLLAGITSIEELDLENQRVFVRVDLDAPTNKNGEIVDDTRIRAAVPTLRRLLDAGARLVVGARYGEARLPMGSLATDKAPSIEPAAALLAEHLAAEVHLPDGCSGDSVKKVISGLRENQLCLLENLASDADVGAGSEGFARVLFDLVDMYVNDAPRALGLESATTTILPRLFERRVAGLQLMAELRAVARVRAGVERPRLLIWGGNSLSERLPLLHKLLGPSDKVFLVGVPGNTLVRAQGGTTGRSAVEETYLAGARTLADQLGDRLLAPTDFRVAESPKAASARTVDAGRLRPDDMALDLGPTSVAALQEEIARSAAVLWCGTAGFHRSETFAGASRAIITSLAESAAFTMVAGEDSVAAVQALGSELAPQIDCVSAGGAATLALLSENKLPGLEALRGISNDAAQTPDRR